MTDYMRYSIKHLLFLWIATQMLLSCTKKNDEYAFEGEALGTSYHIKYFSEKDIPFQNGLDSIIESINNSMSTYRKDSDITKINNGDSSIVIDENFRKVLEQSTKIYKESNGFFDPTVGNLVNAYGFGPDASKNSLDQVQIDSMLIYVGLNKVSLTKDNRLKKKYPKIYLDFNAIAKGYTVDVIANYLDSQNINNYLIELGGELVAKGINKNSNESWVVGIDDPMQTGGNRNLKATLLLKDRGMATSGNYRKFRLDTLTGQRFVHTINPKTGSSEKSNLLSASVLATNCALADGYATAFMALGLERSKEMLSRIKDVDVYFIYAEENEEVKIFTTSGFEEVLRKE